MFRRVTRVFVWLITIYFLVYVPMSFFRKLLEVVSRASYVDNTASRWSRNFALLDMKMLKSKFTKNELMHCLIAEPRLEDNEFSPVEARMSKEQICANDKQNVSFEINGNTERSLKFVYISKQTDEILFTSRNKDDGIPKILHFIWNDDMIPDPFVKNLERFREVHPHWNICFWTVPDGRKFILKYEPHIIPTFDGYRKDVSRADALRYVILYYFGGACFDLDCYPLIPLDNLTNIGDCLFGAEPAENALFVTGMRSLMSTTVLMTKPKQPFFRHLIDFLPRETNLKDPIFAAGPVYLSKRINSYLSSELYSEHAFEIKRPTDIRVVPHDYFEFPPHAGVSKNMESKHCKGVMAEVKSFFNDCYSNNSTSKQCMEIRQSVDPNVRAVFDACLEWLIHGGRDRRTYSVRYVDHVHYGTYDSNKIFKMKTVKITKIIPDVIKMYVNSTTV